MLTNILISYAQVLPPPSTSNFEVLGNIRLDRYWLNIAQSHSKVGTNGPSLVSGHLNDFKHRDLISFPTRIILLSVHKLCGYCSYQLTFAREGAFQTLYPLELRTCYIKKMVLESWDNYERTKYLEPGKSPEQPLRNLTQDRSTNYIAYLTGEKDSLYVIGMRGKDNRACYVISRSPSLIFAANDFKGQLAVGNKLAALKRSSLNTRILIWPVRYPHTSQRVP